MRVNRTHLVGGGGLDDAVGGALEGHGHAPAFGLRLPHAGENAELLRVDGRGELDLQALDRDLTKVLERVDHDEPALAEDRDAMGDALDLREGVRREEHRSSLRAHLPQQRVEALLHQRVETGDRLVQDQQLGLVHEGLDQADLLAVAGRELAHRPIELGVEALGERGAQAPVHAASELGQVVQYLRSGQLRVQGEIAGQETDPAADIEALGASVEPEHPRRARGRLDQVQEQPHRRRLARAVGAEEAEDLARLDLEVEVEEAVPGAVVLRKTLRSDRGMRAYLPWTSLRSERSSRWSLCSWRCWRWASASSALMRPVGGWMSVFNACEDAVAVPSWPLALTTTICVGPGIETPLTPARNAAV